MAVEQVESSNPAGVAGVSEELLDRRYIVNRDELLWRDYSRYLARGDRAGVNNANRILRIIREAPE